MILTAWFSGSRAGVEIMGWAVTFRLASVIALAVVVVTVDIAEGGDEFG